MEDEDVIIKAFLRQYQRGIVNPGEGVGAGVDAPGQLLWHAAAHEVGVEEPQQVEVVGPAQVRRHRAQHHRDDAEHGAAVELDGLASHDEGAVHDAGLLARRPQDVQLGEAEDVDVELREHAVEGVAARDAAGQLVLLAAAFEQTLHGPR